MLVAVAAAGGAFVALRQRAKPVAIPAATIRRQPTELILPATIRAQSVVSVAVPVQGTVESLDAVVGQQVYEGQSLGRIRNTGLDADQQSAAAGLERAQARLSDLENQLIVARPEATRARADAARAQSEFDRAERAYQRQQMLLKEGATPKLVYEKAARDYESAKAERDSMAGLAHSAEDRLSGLVARVDAARRPLDEYMQALDRAKLAAAAAEIRSPVTGMVVGCTKKLGEEVTPDVQDLFQIATDLSALEAVVEPGTEALGRLRVGQEALVIVTEAPDAIAARITQIQGNQVVIRFASPTVAVRPGITAQVRIKVS